MAKRLIEKVENCEDCSWQDNDPIGSGACCLKDNLEREIPPSGVAPWCSLPDWTEEDEYDEKTTD